MATNKKSSGKRVSVYSSDHKHIPITRTEYVKRGGKWVKTESETYMGSRNMAQRILADTAQPFERSHSRKKADRYGHSHEFDTYQTISGDGSQKCVWHVDYAQGERNFSKITRKSWQDRMRRKKKKAAK